MKVWKNTNTLDQLVQDLSGAGCEPGDAEIAVIGGKPIDLTKMPNLRGIFKCGVGVDNVPFDEAAQRGIRISLPSQETREILLEETANFAVYLIYRMLFDHVGDVDHWIKHPRPFLGDRRVLIVGMGNIGSMVFRKLEPNMEVISFDVSENESDDLKAMMAQAEVVSLHIPLDENTRGFIDKEKLGWLNNGAALVNTARGPIVDEDALFNEIDSGRLRAAFDVFWNEPYYGKLRSLTARGFLMTPHIASTCSGFLKGLAKDYLVFKSELENND